MCVLLGLSIAIIFILFSEIVLIDGTGPKDLIFLNDILGPAIADANESTQFVIIV